jgi:hypothetical protein
MKARGIALDALYDGINKKYLSKDNETPWSNTNDQHFPNPEFKNQGYGGPPTQMNSDSNFIAIDIPDLNEGGEDPIAGVPDFEPALANQEPCSPSLDFPATCDDKLKT